MANSFKLLDLFSGIGGFHLGLEQAGFKFDWTGFSEIDKYANKQYKKRFPNARELGDVTAIQCEDLPKDIDILCGGFPCQTFSIAGKRKGFDDTRGTLFFEIARILRYFRGTEQPIPYFILENVKGLLNHEDGRTFATIYRVLADLDYSVECQLLNTRWFLPQNRERIYIVGRFRGGSRSKIFPIGKHGRTNNENRKKDKTRISAAPSREYGWKKVSPTLCSRDYKDPKLVKIKPVLTTGFHGQNGRRFKEDGEDMFTLNTQDQHGVYITRDSRDNSKPGISGSLRASRTLELGFPGTSIRRLTPTECERLQGFPDGWTEGQSDTQRYKQLGNAVSVPVVKAIGDKLIKCFG